MIAGNIDPGMSIVMDQINDPGCAVPMTTVNDPMSLSSLAYDPNNPPEVVTDNPDYPYGYSRFPITEEMIVKAYSVVQRYKPGFMEAAIDVAVKDGGNDEFEN
jgi:hypothetical protein